MIKGQGQRSARQPRRLMISVALTGFCAAAVLGVSNAGAQDGPNPSLKLSYGTRLSINDNKALKPVSAGTTTSLDNNLDLSYLTETATSSLRIDMGTVLRFADEPGRRSVQGFDGHHAAISYARNGANSALSANASFRQSDVSTFDPFLLAAEPGATFDSGDLVAGSTGTRTDRSASLGFETGIEGPLGFSANLSRRERSFDGTVNPADFFATTTDNLGLGARLQLSDRSTARISLSRSVYDAEDAALTHRKTQKLSLGLDHALTPSLTLGATVGKTRIDLDETAGATRSRTSRSGFAGSLSLDKALTNGTVGLAYSRNISINGARDSLQVSRRMDLPSGKLELALGTAQVSGRKSTWTGNIAYSHDLPRGTISASLDRRGTTTESNDDVVSSRASLGWAQSLTSQTGIKMSIDYLDVASDLPGKDRSRTRLSMAYTWDLAQDWQLQGGYTHSRLHDETSGNARANLVFLSLQRAITLAP